MVFHQDKSWSHASNRRWRTFVYTFPKRERCYTSGVDALRCRCRPDWFCYLGNPYKRLTEANETYHLVSLKRALWDTWRKLDHSIINNTLGSWYKQSRLIYNLHGSQIENILQWKSYYEKFIDKVKVFQNWWITSRIMRWTSWKSWYGVLPWRTVKLFITSLFITEYSISNINMQGTDLFPLKLPLYNRILTERHRQ